MTNNVPYMDSKFLSNLISYLIVYVNLPVFRMIVVNRKLIDEYVAPFTRLVSAFLAERCEIMCEGRREVCFGRRNSLMSGQRHHC